MPSDLRVLLGTSPLAPNGEAYETYKLQADDTYAKAVFAYVSDNPPLNVQFPPGTPAITANFTQTPSDPALRTTLEQTAPIEVTVSNPAAPISFPAVQTVEIQQDALATPLRVEIDQAAPIAVTVSNPAQPVQFPALQAVAIQQQPTDEPIRVTLETPLYSVATPTMDGLMSSTDKIAHNALVNTFKITPASEPTVDKNFTVSDTSLDPSNHKNVYVTAGDKTLRLTAYPSTHTARGNQVWVNAQTPDTRLVFGVNNAYAGGFSPSGTSFNVGLPSDAGDEGSRIIVHNEGAGANKNSLYRVVSREAGAYVILTGKTNQEIQFTDLNYNTRGGFRFTDSTTGGRRITQNVGGAFSEIDEAGILRVGNGSHVSEHGWRSLNGLHFNYDSNTGIATNPWVKIGNFPPAEGAIIFEVVTITDYNYEAFNSAEICLKRFRPGNGSMSANMKPTSENESGIYFGFNPSTGDVFLKCTVLWGSVASYTIKFANTAFYHSTPTVFTGVVENEIGSPTGFPKIKRVFA